MTDFEKLEGQTDDINLKTSDDLETICGIAESGNFTEQEKSELLSRKDVDVNYSDIYFFAMCPYSTIREAINYSKNNK